MGGQAHRAETRLMTKGDTAMDQQTTTPDVASSEMWERLDVFVREHLQQVIPALRAEEVTAW